MSEPVFHLTDADLDRALDAFLLGGPDDTGERVAANALRAVATVRQQRLGIWSAVGLPRWRGLLAAATVLVGVAVGYGAWRAVELAVPPTPTPSPSSTWQPSSTATPMTTYAYPEDGYSITLSDAWALWDPGAFHDQTKPELTLWILAGTPDGRLAACSYGPLSIFGQAPPTGPPCSELVFRTASDLAAVVQATRKVGTIDLAGEEVALYQRFTFDGYDYALYDVHDGRPFVMHVAFTYVVDGLDVDPQTVTQLVQEALVGFRYLP